MNIDAKNLPYEELNRQIKTAPDAEIIIQNCCGQRYLANGLSHKRLTVSGVPGNALGAYLDGAEITVEGNAQEATGDTMNDGKIFVDGMAGDATGYAMRGGEIYIRANTGYRAGIHMKEYEEKQPWLIVGGEAGSFLGEYQAGGAIVVLGLQSRGGAPIGNFCGVGMYGGKIFLRCSEPPKNLSGRLLCKKAGEEEMALLLPKLENFSKAFSVPMEEILDTPFFLITPDSQNPYQQLYTQN